MNCEDFNKIIDELAEQGLMQAALRDAGVSHVALCPECATKLANARTLRSSLLLAARAESESAPARIKENLLTAFAAQQRTDAQPARVVDISSRRQPRWSAAAALAVAAVILLAVIVPIWRKASAPTSSPTNELQASLPEATTTPAVVEEAPVAPVKSQPAAEAAPKMTKAAPTTRRLRPRTSELASRKRAYETIAQNTTEYLPLTYLATATAMDSGTIIRVELSRSALASLGFPVSAEGTGSVKAEVVLGDDGVAQAIRLVE